MQSSIIKKNHKIWQLSSKLVHVITILTNIPLLILKILFIRRISHHHKLFSLPKASPRDHWQLFEQDFQAKRPSWHERNSIRELKEKLQSMQNTKCKYSHAYATAIVQWKHCTSQIVRRHFKHMDCKSVILSCMSEHNCKLCSTLVHTKTDRQTDTHLTASFAGQPS